MKKRHLYLAVVRHEAEANIRTDSSTKEKVNEIPTHLLV